MDTVSGRPPNSLEQRLTVLRLARARSQALHPGKPADHNLAKLKPQCVAAPGAEEIGRADRQGLAVRTSLAVLTNHAYGIFTVA